ncbi:MAG: PspC domain-containing protein [Chitinophagales bacterium]|nr:PspC domain-containing protein [Chitinophagales bacterium]
MKKTLNINLGGMAFIIDENAFEMLSGYLEALKKKFSNETERTEILNDIEARMAEMFTEQLGNRKEVIGLSEVEFVIAQMGKPEDIAGEESTAETGNTTSNAAETAPGRKIQKRLYRDPEDAKIGGVIAGLCHYFGINDPVWARIAAVILIPVTSGSIIFVYLLLLIIVPKALTAAEKLQMKGEPININTIEKEVKEAANKFTASVKVNVDSENFFQKLWNIVVMIAGFFFRLLAFVFILAGVIALFAVLLGFIVFAVIGTSPFNSITHLIVNESSLITLSAIGFLLFFGAPLVGLIYSGLRVLIGRGSEMPWLKWTLGATWLAGLAMLLYAGLKVGMDFKTAAATKEKMVLMQPAKGNLFVQLADSTDAGWVTVDEEADEDEDEVHFGAIIINGKNIEDITSFKIGKPHLELMVSETDSFYLTKIVSSQGRNRNDAVKNADMVMYSFLQTDTLLNLKNQFEIAKKGGKYRAQQMTLRLAIPEGKTVRFGSNIDELTAVVKGDSYYDDTYFANTVWTVENGKVKCLNCGEDADKQQQKIEMHIEKTEKKLQEQEKKLDEKMKQAEEKIKVMEKKMKKQDNGNSNQDF